MNEPAEPIRTKSEASEDTRSQPLEIPVIQVDESSPRATKTKRSKTSRPGRSRTSGFNPTALEHLVESGPTTPPDVPPAQDVAKDSEDPPDAPVTEEDTLSGDLDATVAEAIEPQRSSGESDECDDEQHRREADTEEPAAPCLQTDTVSSKSGKIAKAAHRSSKRQPIRRTAAESAAAKSRPGPRSSSRQRAPGGQRANRIPASWIAAGACAGSALVVVILLVNLLGGDGSDGPSRSPERGASAPSSTPRSLPTFQSELPPASSAASGVRPMDAEEQARRREGMASFAEMGRQEEAKLHEEQAKAKKKPARSDNPR